MMLESRSIPAIADTDASIQAIDGEHWVEVESSAGFGANNRLKAVVVIANLLLYVSVMAFSFVPDVRMLVATMLG